MIPDEDALGFLLFTAPIGPKPQRPVAGSKERSVFIFRPEVFGLRVPNSRVQADEELPGWPPPKSDRTTENVMIR